MADKISSRRWKTVLNTVTIVALVGLAWALRDQLRATFEQFREINAPVLVGMVVFQSLNYLAQAKLYQGLFRAVGDRFRFKSMIRLALELNFVNTVFPSGGVSGFSYLAIRLRNEGVSAGKATFVQMLRFTLIFMSVQILLAVGLVALAIGGKANDFAILVAGVIFTLIFVGTALGAYIIGSKNRINVFFTFLTQLLNRIIHVVRRGNPETISIHRAKRAVTEMHEQYIALRTNPKQLRQPLLFALASMVAEILTIYTVYLAFGEWVNIGAVILAYSVANFAGLLSIFPGGIGIYEALMTGVLTAAGIPAALSLSVTVMYRVLSMLIQLPPGYFFYHRTLRAEPAVEKHFEHGHK